MVEERLSSLQRRGREAAQEQDAIALAEAIEEGKEEPKTNNVEQIDKEIAACERRVAALEIVVDNLEQSLIAVVDEHRDEWVEEVDAELTADFEMYGDAIEAVASARAHISQKFGLRRWLHGFPETNPVYAEGGSSVVVALKAMHGDPYTFTQVIDALRQDAQTVSRRRGCANPRSARSRDAPTPRGKATEPRGGTRLLHGQRTAAPESEPVRVRPRARRKPREAGSRAERRACLTSTTHRRVKTTSFTLVSRL